jgi:hypothetical protein
MKFPFLFAQVPEPKPRVHLGRSPNLDPAQRELLDVIDVMEQKMDYAISMGTRAYNLSVVLAMILILTNGPAVLGIVQKWLGGAPAVATKVTENKK